MSMITDISERRGLVEIVADGSAVARIRKAHFARCPVHAGEDIDVDAYLDRVASVQLADAYEAALSSLDVCARSAKEIAASLRRRGYVEPVVEAVLARLTENRLIDDARYAERMAEVQSQKGTGIYAFKRRLKAKGISDEDAEAALSAFDDEQQQAACLATAEKLVRKYAELPPREARARLGQALARRGFGWDTIEGVVDQLID